MNNKVKPTWPKRRFPPKDWRDLTVWGLSYEQPPEADPIKLAYGIYTRILAVEWADYMFSGGRFRRCEVRDPDGNVIYTKSEGVTQIKDETASSPEAEEKAG